MVDFARNNDLVLIQFKTPTERKRDFQIYCRKKGFPSMSACINMMIVKLLEDEKTMPDPRTLAPIENAVREIRELLPVMDRYGLLGQYSYKK